MGVIANKDLFFFFFFFWKAPDFGQKNALNFDEHLFFLFLEITWFSLNNIASIHFETNEISGQLRLRLNHTSKKPPPLFAKSWLRDWVLAS